MKSIWTRVALFVGGTIALNLTQRTPIAEAQAKTDGTAIRPFRVHYPDEALADLKRRIAATRVRDDDAL